jgi:hypothetical protein
MSNELTKALEIIRNMPVAGKVRETIIAYDAIIGICAKLYLLDADSLEELRGMVITEAARCTDDIQDSRALRCFEQIIRIYQEE